MYLDAAVMDMEEALRTLEIVGAKMGQLDLLMRVKGQRQGQIQGESVRKFINDQPHHAILGYYLAAGSPTDSASGQSTGRRRYSAMRVVRNSDSSTSQLLNAFSTNEGLTVILDSYRAGGDDSKDASPMFHIELTEARVRSFTLMSGGALPNTGGVEIIEFAFREINTESGPQTNTGDRGAVKIFQDSLSGQT